MPPDVGYFIAEQVAGCPSPQDSDVDRGDDRGLIHLADRNVGFDVP